MKFYTLILYSLVGFTLLSYGKASEAQAKWYWYSECTKEKGETED